MHAAAQGFCHLKTELTTHALLVFRAQHHSKMLMLTTVAQVISIKTQEY